MRESSQSSLAGRQGPGGKNQNVIAEQNEDYCDRLRGIELTRHVNFWCCTFESQSINTNGDKTVGSESITKNTPTTTTTTTKQENDTTTVNETTVTGSSSTTDSDESTVSTADIGSESTGPVVDMDVFGQLLEIVSRTECHCRASDTGQEILCNRTLHV